MKNQSRRSFLLGLATFLGVAATWSGLFGSLVQSSLAAPAKGKDVPLPAGETEVTTADVVANAIGYNPDSTKVDVKSNPTFKKGQDCSSCALYTKTNESWGKCQMIQVGLVRSHGWCRSYNKKA